MGNPYKENYVLPRGHYLAPIGVKICMMVECVPHVGFSTFGSDIFRGIQMGVKNGTFFAQFIFGVSSSLCVVHTPLKRGSTAVRAECRRSLVYSRRTSEHTTPLLCSFTGYASRNKSSSGCVFWRTTVCVAQHRRTCLTACGRLTPRHHKCRRLVGLPLATAPFPWLQLVRGTVCH